MKKTTISLLAFIGFATGTFAAEHTCTTQWLAYPGETKIYMPADSVKTVYLTFMNGLNSVKFRTKNNSSYYEYNTMIITPEKRGVSYRASKEKELAIFDNHILLLLSGDTIILRATCPTIDLDLKELKK